MLHAVPIALFILGIFYYWFGVADRYVVFLYEHLGATPFDTMTSGRYWMTGLVASGTVMIGYTLINWLLGQIATLRHRNYCSPVWWRVWGLCVLPLIVGIPWITMTLNWPTLPFANAIACVTAALIGLALALMPGSWASQRPTDLCWLAFDALGLMPTLTLLRAVELPARGLISVWVAWLIAIGGTVMGAVWLGIMTGLRAWRRRPLSSAGTLFVAGLCQSYLLMPLVHHIFSTPPGYPYISTASNFFAFTVGLQLLVFVVVAVLSIAVTRWRRSFKIQHPGGVLNE
ncbi:MAG: hypothetical protein GY832_14560 [Chloroflexi bacterium]|nr:hypothetical protein [Chloroflexota bacterium]